MPASTPVHPRASGARRGRAHTAITAAAAAAVVLLLAAGCKDVASRVFAQPSVAFRDVRLRGIGIQGGTVDVVLRVANPNPYALTATAATYRLLTGDSVEVGRGTTAQAYTVAAHDSALVTLPLDVSWRGLRDAGRAALAGGAVPYRVLGTITADTPIGAHDFPIDARGRFAALGAGAP
jgi:LEA14-like dessication related protein